MYRYQVRVQQRRSEMNRWVATRSRRHTYQWITDHKSPRDHYRHISE
ncbi:hypothetical protein, partial [Mycobacterium tuberculosis]